MADKKVKAQLELDASGVKKGAEEAEGAIKKVKDSIKDLGDTSKAPDKVKDSLEDVGESANKAKPKVDNLKLALDSIQKVGQTLTTTLTLPIVGFGAMAVNTTKDFKYSMAEVSAISGATGEDLAKLEEQAKTLGATTFFSATEASQAMKMYAMAGYEVNEIMSVLPGTLDLSIASGTNLATTADIVSDAMTALKMEAKDTNKFVDILAKTSMKSNTNVEMLGESFKYVAPVAGELGIKAEDLAVALGLMANAGVKGSMSGTQMRTALSRLVKPTKEMSAVMEKYNIALQLNEDGTVDLMDTMVHLREKLGGLDETTRANVLATLMGQEAMAGWSAIVGALPEDFETLTNEIYNADGAAKQMADTMGNTFEGKIKNMKSAFEGVQLVIGEKLIPILEKVVEKVTDVCNWFIELDGDSQGLILSIAGVVAGIGPMLMLFSGAVKTFSNVKKGLDAISGAMGLTNGSSLLLKGGVVALLGSFVLLMNEIGQSSSMISNLQRDFGFLGETISTMAEMISGTVQGPFNTLKIFFSTLGKSIMALMKGDFKEFTSIWRDGWAEMAVNSSKAMSNFSGHTSFAIKQIRQMSEEEIGALEDNFTSTMDILSTVTTENTDKIASTFTQNFKDMSLESLGALRGSSETMSVLLDGIHAGMDNDKMTKTFSKNLENMVRSGELSLENLQASTNEFSSVIAQNISTGATEVGNAGKTLFENFKNEATRGINETATLIVSDIEKMNSDTFTVLQGCGDTWGQVFEGIANDGSMSTEQMKNKIIENFTAMGISGSEAMKLLETELSNATSNMSTTTEANLSTLPSTVGSAVNGMVTESSKASQVKDNINNGTSGTDTVVSNNLSGTSTAVSNEVNSAVKSSSDASKIKDNLDKGTSGASQVVDKNLSGMSSSVDKNTSNLSKTSDTNFSKMKKSADTNTKAMADSVKRNATSMYTGAKNSFTSLANSASTSTANMKNNVINNVAIMKNSATKFWNELRNTYSKSITGEIKITRTITEKVNKIVSVETEDASKSMASLLTKDDTINLTEKNSALKSLAIIKSTDRMKAEDDKKKDKPSVVKNTNNVTYNYSYTSPVESSITELRRKDRIQAQRIALSR